MLVTIADDPKTFEQAISEKDSCEWKNAMDEEYNSLIKNGTWKLVDSPKGEKVIDNRWVYKIK